MCGIGAIFHMGSSPTSIDKNTLFAMRDAILHRGPDGDGTWLSPAQNMGAVHTRLAIQDLSDAGAQPMLSQNKRYVLVLNGEIYNHVELRQGLPKDIAFRSSSDTETLLQLLIHEGEKCLPKLNGMFALAFFDIVKGTLLIARDAFGQKPLYVVERDHSVSLASEVRALLPQSSQKPSQAGLSSLAAKGSIAFPYTQYQDVRLFPPGAHMTFHSDGRRTGPIAFWRMPWALEIDSKERAIAELSDALQKATERILVSDVPVGAFLSGGIDSASLCALMVAAGKSDLQTYTVSLPGDDLDEGQLARMMAKRLGTQHTELAIDDIKGRQLLADARARMDVPSIDGANTYIVARAVREAGCTVAVSGIGGDELFGGYPTFHDAMRVSGLLKSTPGFIARGAGFFAKAALAQATSLGVHGGLANKNARLQTALRHGLTAAALYAARRGVDANALERLGLDAAQSDPGFGYDYSADLQERAGRVDVHPAQQALEFEQRIYMHDQLLRDTDQFGMAHALEIRAPFLDTDLAKVVAKIHPRLFCEEGQKSLLVDAVERATGVRLPDEITKRDKQGFTLPIARWAKSAVSEGAA